jgi:alkylhydroperoxidase family enzyme
VVEKALADAEGMPFSEAVRAMLECLKKLTLDPSAVTAADVRVVLDNGVTREQVRDAMYVCYLFNTYDRLADTFKWRIPVQAAFEASAKRLLSHGYGM